MTCVCRRHGVSPECQLHGPFGYHTLESAYAHLKPWPEASDGR